MKVVCLQKNLAEGLALVNRAIATRGSLPVLANVLLKTEDNRLKLCATNLEIGIVSWVGAKVEEDGAITVPARLLMGFVNSLPPDRVEMALENRTKTLCLHCAQHQARIKGIDATEFPLMPEVKDAPTTLHLDAQWLQEMIAQVVFAAATDETRPVLTGVLIRLDDSALTMVASDGFRLSLRQADLGAAVPQSQRVIVPAKTLQELYRILADEKEVEITIAPARKQVFFHTEKADIISQLVEGNFPDHQRFLPQRYSTRAVLDRTAFQGAIRLARFFAQSAAHIIRLHVVPGESTVWVSSHSPETGENVSQVEADIEGEEIEINFNGEYLAHVLSVIDTPQVSLEILTPSSPGIIRPVGRDDFTHIIVPIIIHNPSYSTRRAST
jgi:DNA polymerase-3 subunit beta